MKFKSLLKKIILTGLICIIPGSAFATNGYFSPGFGIKANGMGGVGVALPQDAIAAATNPAGMAFIGDRMDFGLEWFSPIRETTITGSPAIGASKTYKSGSNHFLIPSFGYNRQYSPDMTLGVSFYGNGGMNTAYKEPIPLLGTTNPGVDFMQAFIAPTVTYKINETGAVGLSVNIAVQRLKVYGLQNFDNAMMSSAPGFVTNKGYDYSLGIGGRFGWKGDLTENFSMGITYQTPTKMQKFEQYKGLFAEQGGFDVPQNAAVGIAIKEIIPKTTFAFDVEWIDYSQVASVNNKLLPITAMMTPGTQLGDDNGSGFGWQEQFVFKVGIQHEYSKDVAIRAGYNYGKNPLPSSENLFNIIAPAVVEHHLTLGATIKVNEKYEVTFAFIHVFENTAKGSGSIPAAFGGGEVDLTMYQNSFGVSVGW